MNPQNIVISETKLELGRIISHLYNGFVFSDEILKLSNFYNKVEANHLRQWRFYYDWIRGSFYAESWDNTKINKDVSNNLILYIMLIFKIKEYYKSNEYKALKYFGIR